MATEPLRDSRVLDAFREGVTLKEEAAASGDPEAMRDAVDALESIQRHFPQERAVIAKSLLQLADCFELAGDPERARSLLVRVANEFSRDDREAAGLAMLGLSRMAAHEGRSTSDVEELWSRSLDTLTDPQQHAHARIWYAQTLLQHGDTAGCQERLLRILGELSSEHGPYLFLWAYDLLGLAHIAEEDRPGAERIVQGLKHALSELVPEEALRSTMTEALLRSPSKRSAPLGSSTLL
jgi:hypothetical protein